MASVEVCYLRIRNLACSDRSVPNISFKASEIAANSCCFFASLGFHVLSELQHIGIGRVKFDQQNAAHMGLGLAAQIVVPLRVLNIRR